MRKIGTNGFLRPRAAVLVVLVAAGMALPPTHAKADHIGCGDVITADTTLDSDLLSCPGDGIVIGADDITLDLNGHTVDGNDSNRVCEYDEELGEVVGGPDCFYEPSDDYGIDNSAGHSRVTVSDGTVKSFGGAAVIVGHWREDNSKTTDNRLHGLAALDSNYGILLANANNNMIEANTTFDNRLGGIWLTDSSHNRIEENRSFRNNGGIELASSILERGSLDNQVYRNRTFGNVERGIGIRPYASGNLVRGNLVLHNGFGIWANGNSNNQIEENRVTGSETAIVLDWCWSSVVSGNLVSGGIVGASKGGNHVLADNLVSGALVGIHLFSTDGNRVLNNRTFRNMRDGITLEVSHNNYVAGNTATRNGRYGIGLGVAYTDTLRDNRVEHNLVRRNEADGIFAGSQAQGTSITQNVTNRNGDDGIDADAASTTLAANTATWNRDLGIEGALGVLDGGSNRAWKNRNPAQCLNVTCAHRSPRHRAD